jgi:hypothetical protein
MEIYFRPLDNGNATEKMRKSSPKSRFGRKAGYLSIPADDGFLTPGF